MTRTKGCLNPFVTACIVTFNSAHVIEPCLRALRRAAEFAAVTCQLCVVDNASQDNSVELVCRLWPEATVIRNSQNVGYAQAANQASACARGEWLLFLNPDTVVPEDTFSVLRRISSQRNIGVFSPLLVDSIGTPVRTAYRWPRLSKEMVRLAGLAGLLTRVVAPLRDVLPSRSRVALPEPLTEAHVVDYPTGACLFIRRSVWDRVGPFDEHFFLYHEEMEWCWRARQVGVQPVVVPALKVVHLGKQSSTGRPPEIVFWRYQGLLHFYCKHKSVMERRVLQGALLVSFGARALVSLLFRRDSARVYWRVAALGLAPLCTRDGPTESATIPGAGQ